MNARQTKKYLKKQIYRLTRDNKLMRDIIDNSPKMAELYDLYNRPCNVTYSTMNFQKYTCKRVIPPYATDSKVYEEQAKRALVGDLARVIENDIQFEVMDMYGTKEIYASIYIGRK